MEKSPITYQEINFVISNLACTPYHPPKRVFQACTMPYQPPISSGYSASVLNPRHFLSSTRKSRKQMFKNHKFSSQKGIS